MENIVALKVAVIVFTGNSGLTHYSYNLCNALSNIENITVELITNENYELEKYKHNFHVTKIFRRSRCYFIDIWKFIYYILKTNPDVIHFQSTLKFPFIEYFIIRLFNVSGIKNIIFTAHDVLPHEQKKYHKPFYKWFYKAMPRIIVHADMAYKILVNDLNYKATAKVIMDGDYRFLHEYSPTCRDDARQHIGLDMRKKVVLFFGRISPDKGLEYLIESFSKVAKKRPDVLLAIVGKPLTPFHEHKYLEMIKEYEITNKVFVRFQHIPLDDIKYYITASDFIVLPYINATTSGVIKLAYSFSKPVIATNVGNFPEMVDDGKTGFIVPQRNTDKMAEKILTLLDDDVFLDKMSRAVLNIREKYSWDKIAVDTMKLYLQS